MYIQENSDVSLKKNNSSIKFLVVELILISFLLIVWSSVMRSTEFVGYFFLGGIMTLFGIIGLVIGIINTKKKNGVVSSVMLIIVSIILIFGVGLVDRLSKVLNPDTEQERQQRFYEQSLQERYRGLPNEGLPY